MIDKSRHFTVLIRIGYAARGMVYILLGYLALNSAEAASAGAKASFDFVQSVPAGSAVLGVTAVGLLAYALFKFVAAVGDIENKGAGAKGIAQRIGYTASGMAHVLLAWSAFEFARGTKSTPSADGGNAAANTLLTWDMGAVVLGGIGIGFVLAAVLQGRTAVTAHFMRSVGAGAPSSICWIGRMGHAARAIVFAVIGWSLVKSAWLHNGADVKGLGSALASLRESGAIYTVVALGLLMFGVFSLVVARFRIIPDVEKSDLEPSFR